MMKNHRLDMEVSAGGGDLTPGTEGLSWGWESPLGPCHWGGQHITEGDGGRSVALGGWHKSCCYVQAPAHSVWSLL